MLSKQQTKRNRGQNLESPILAICKRYRLTTRFLFRENNSEKPMPTQQKKSKVVLASGVFDLLHLGHVKFLEEAKKAGGENTKLIVVIARDSTVEKTKGRKPIMPENQRRALVESLKVVDEATLGLENFNISDIVQRVRPDIIALGYDQTYMKSRVRDCLKENGLSVKVIQIDKFESDELDSSSKIRQKIVKKFSR